MLFGGAFGYLSDYLLWCGLYASLLVHIWCFFRLFPHRRWVKMRLVIGNGLVFLGLGGCVALAGESYYRFVCVETDSFGMSLPAQRWFALNVQLNSLGCRDKEWTPEPRVSARAMTNDPSPPGGRVLEADVRRIAFVGDSFTYGWGIEHVEDRFSDRIQAMFDPARDRANRNVRAEGASPRTKSEPRARARGQNTVSTRVEVLNVAKPGWGTGDQIQPVSDMIEVYGVDEVVLCYVPNDIEKLLPRTPEFDPIRPPELTLFNPSTSCLVDYLFYRVVVPRVGTVRNYHDWLAEGFVDPDIWRAHQQQLYSLIQLCHNNGVLMRVALLPFLRTGGEKFQPEKLHATLRMFFEQNDVAVVDLLPVIAGYDPSDLTVNAHDAHPNEKAHELFANAIWQAFFAPGG